jgi:hypothetical protein
MTSHRTLPALTILFFLSGCGGGPAPQAEERGATIEPARSVEHEPSVEHADEAPDLAVCPPTEGEIRTYVALSEREFSVERTDGMMVALPYEATDYPFDALRERLVQLRHFEPEKTRVFVTAEDGFPRTAAERAVAIAREVGFTESLLCVADEMAPGEPTFGFGGLGLRAPEDMGEDEGEPSPRPVARVRAEPADVRGALSPAVVRRVVERHLGELRTCYEAELLRSPELRGRVVVSFIIAADGRVQAAATANSTVANARVEACIAQALRGLEFPAPEEGIVAVSAPFLLGTP